MAKVTSIPKPKKVPKPKPPLEKDVQKAIQEAKPGEVDINARFWSKISPGGPLECWVWNAGKIPDGYGQFWDGGKMVSAHRFAFRLVVGEIPEGMQLDHLCHNRACVNPKHMRVCSLAENTRNRVRPATNTSGFKGVTWFAPGKKWAARISVDGKALHLGYFKTPETAYLAYCEAAIKLHGEFANLGMGGSFDIENG